MWSRRIFDNKLPIDMAASENNKWVDRSRVIVWLRRKMGLEEVKSGDASHPPSLSLPQDVLEPTEA
eukprot:751349-Hanusia_phi.AAC.2